MDKVWAEVDSYFGDLFVPRDEKLEAALAANRKAELPAIDVSKLQGKFLELLVRITGAKRILEIGTLGGYSTIWMARALPEGGKIVTLEFNPRHAEVARQNLHHAGVLERVDLRVGRAIENLPALEGSEPFDLVFIDADKGTIDLAVSDAELAARRAAWAPRRTDYNAGAIWKYAQLVGPAHLGAVTHPGTAAETHCYADI